MEARDMVVRSGNRVYNDLGDNARLVKKWGKMVEGISDQWMRIQTAKLYENEMMHFRNISNRLLESSSTANIPNLVRFTFPLIRKVWPELISKDLFSVQATTSPIGGIFYWDYKYGTSKGSITANMNMIENFDRNYSSEFVEGEVVGTGSAHFTGILAWHPVKPAGLGQVGVIFQGTTAGGTVLRIYDSAGTGALAGDVGGGSTITHSSGAYDITFSASVNSVTATYWFDMEAISANVPQVNVDIQLEAIKVWSRKIKILWSSEATDDMRAVLGMDIEPELTAGIANEIGLGIDRELIMTAYGSGTTNIAPFDAAVPAGMNQVDHYRNIMTVIEKVSGGINTRTHRGPGNFIITGPSVQPVLGALATHGDLRHVVDFGGGGVIDPGKGVTGRDAFALPQVGSGYGIYTMGFLQNKWRVIIDPYFPSGEMLIGLKGPMFADSGVVYAPYVPLEMTAAFLDPADFTLRKGMRTRYARKMTNANFYGRVQVSNLP